jgi:hypothetical protein
MIVSVLRTNIHAITPARINATGTMRNRYLNSDSLLAMMAKIAASTT